MAESYYIESVLNNLPLPVNFSRIVTASLRDKYDVFLSHSSKDKNVIAYIATEIEKKGFSVYVDWIEDADIGRGEISYRIKQAIAVSSKLLYIHTHNSSLSKWTPWEIGYFDSNKSKENIAILPLLDNNGIYKKLPSYAGQEYLQQYKTISNEEVSSYLKTK